MEDAATIDRVAPAEGIEAREGTVVALSWSFLHGRHARRWFVLDRDRPLDIAASMWTLEEVRMATPTV
jgi:hypothetical protein